MSQNDFSPCYRALIISLRFPVFAFAVFTLAVISQVEIEYRLVDAGLIAEFIGVSTLLRTWCAVLIHPVLLCDYTGHLRAPDLCPCQVRLQVPQASTNLQFGIRNRDYASHRLWPVWRMGW